MAKAKTFVDTNILVYQLDIKSPVKSERSRDRLLSLGTSAIVSSQVLQEFYYTVTRKLLVDPLEAERLVKIMCGWTVVPHSAELVQAAISTSRQSQLSLWDALIVEAAVSAGCSILLTEDLNHGQVIRGVRIENPFLSLG